MIPTEQQLTQVRDEYHRLERDLQQAQAVGDGRRIAVLAKRYAELTDVLAGVERWQHLQRQVAEARQAAQDPTDPELQAMAAAELTSLATEQAHIEDQLQSSLNPADPNDQNDALVEIRAGAGGDEAALFASEVFRMYARFAERQGWTTSLLSSSPTGIGGLKEVIFEISGPAAYGWMKYESGVHRVQRVPVTEKSGRVHTSTITVAVMPEVEEADLVIDPKDLKIVASTSSGAGGQSVNTTYSAIRLTHLPTGITVSMQDERSQTQNRLKAMQVLRARLLARQEEERRQRDSALRKSQIGSGDRSEKIRTYNVPQDRLTDHRIKVTMHHLDQIFDGDLAALLSQLRQAEQRLRATQTP